MKRIFSHIILSVVFAGSVFSQDSPDSLTIDLKGQVSAYGNYNFENYLDVLVGGNFIPELVIAKPLKKKRLLDLDVSANIFGSLNFHPFDSLRHQGDIAPYRAWVRYSGKQFELRAGLQKINFGSATAFRPLRWFDQVDPRDPLALTPGVYGLLGRYYFLNNANIWLWGLYGNDGQKGWEQVRTFKDHPEFGGRFQTPVPKGEMGFTYHHRTADSRHLNIPDWSYRQIPENRYGLDGKWDIGPGVWFEATQSIKNKNVGLLTNQTMINIGMDYTFGIGSGLNVVGEHLITSFDEKPFEFQTTQNLSAITASYPLGMFSNLSTVLYYDWRSEGFFSFVNYQRDLRYFTLFVMAYLNPKDDPGIQQNDLVNNYNGKGLQLMLLYNF